MSSPSPDPSAPPWPQYAEAVIELLIDGEHVVLTPSGREGDVAGSGALAGTGRPLWVLTAGDPYPTTLAADENETRNAALRRDLLAAGLEPMPALGRSADGSTSERSFAVIGGDRRTVLEFAARHGQLAVYEIEDRIRCVDVATASVVTAVPYRTERAPADSSTSIGPTG